MEGYVPENNVIFWKVFATAHFLSTAAYGIQILKTKISQTCFGRTFKVTCNLSGSPTTSVFFFEKFHKPLVLKAIQTLVHF